MFSIRSFVYSASILCPMFLGMCSSKALTQAYGASRDPWNSSAYEVNSATLPEIDSTELLEERPQEPPEEPEEPEEPPEEPAQPCNDQSQEDQSGEPSGGSLGNEPEDWRPAISEGKRLYKVWEAREGPDKIADFSFVVAEQFMGYLQLSQEMLLESLGYSVEEFGGPDAEYEGYDVRFPPSANPPLVEETTTEIPPPPFLLNTMWFSCEISASEGVIIVQEWFIGVQAPRRFSYGDFVWGAWEEAARKHYEEKRAPRGHIRMTTGDLMTIIFEPTDEPDTVNLIKKAPVPRSLKASGTWTLWAPENIYQQSPQDDFFWAVLGSPVGQIVQSILTEHNGMLRGKRVQCIRINTARPKIHPPLGFPAIGITFELDKHHCRLPWKTKYFE